jgi:hypothetical protein
MGTAEQDRKFVPPYIAFLTFLHLLERMETEGLPLQVDRTFLRGSNTSNTQLMNALKSLGLIGDDGKVTESMRQLVESPTERKQLVGRLLTTYYPEAVQLGTGNTTHGQLEKAFGDAYGVTGSTLRKAVSFFLQAADYAQIQRSRYWRKPNQRTAIARKPRTPQRQNSSAPTTSSSSAEQSHTSHEVGLHPSLSAMVGDLKKYKDGWTADERNMWVMTFEQILDYAIRIKDGDESDEG